MDYAPAEAPRYSDGERGIITVIPSILTLLLSLALFLFALDRIGGLAASPIVAVGVVLSVLVLDNVVATRAFPFLRLAREEDFFEEGDQAWAAIMLIAPPGMVAVSALPAAFAFKREEQEAWAQCVICLALVRIGDSVRRLPACSHLFHADCVDEWLCAHATCPLCHAAIVCSGQELPV